MGYLHGIMPFFVYFALATGLIILFLFVYLKITRHDEIALIRDGNLAASLGLGGNLIGFVLPLSRAVQQAASPLDCLIWGVVAFGVQLLVYALAHILIPGLSGEIEKKNSAAGATLGAIAISGGLLNAASMTL